MVPTKFISILVNDHTKYMFNLIIPMCIFTAFLSIIQFDIIIMHGRRNTGGGGIPPPNILPTKKIKSLKIYK